MALWTGSRFDNPDAAYGLIVEAHRTLSEAESHALNARLVLILANHVGDRSVLAEALALGRQATTHPQDASMPSRQSRKDNNEREIRMFSHVTVGTNDFDRATAFYDALLPPLGLGSIERDADHGYAGYARGPGQPPQFWIMRPIDGKPATVGNGVTVAFEAATRADVDAFHATALAAGGTDEGAPGLRPWYHPDYYGAYVRDRDGNKLCIACHAPG